MLKISENIILLIYKLYIIMNQEMLSKEVAATGSSLPQFFNNEVMSYLQKPGRTPQSSPHLVFREYLYGHKDGENFVFDPENYGIIQWLEIMEAKSDQVKVVITDTVIDYWSNGVREIKAAERPVVLAPSIRYWAKKSSYNRDEDWATMEQMLKMFKKDSHLKELDQKYPYLRQNGRFRMDENLETFELAMVPYNAYWLYGNKEFLIQNGHFSTLGNLHKIFKMYADAIRANSYEHIDAFMAQKSIMAYYGSQSPAECKLMAGYTGLPFDVACQCTDDIKALRREYMRNGEPMAVTLGKKVITSKCNDYSKFSEKHGCVTSGDLMFEPEIYFKWAEDFTPAELAIINRERYFDYYNPDMDIQKQKKLIENSRAKEAIRKPSKFLSLWHS